MRTTIRKWGNGLGVRIPPELAEKAGIGVGLVLEVSIHDGNLQLTIPAPVRYRLKDLLKKVTAENLHTALDYGDPD